MCGRYVIVSKVKEIEERFQAKFTFVHQKNFNVSAGQIAPIITQEDQHTIQAFRFGFTPSWAKKLTYMINARAEGDHNKENDPHFKGAKGIINKPFYRKAIRSQRCLVLADAFIEGTTKEKLDQPFLVYLRKKKRPFAFAGIYDEWLDQSSGELINTFAIITCPPNKLLQKIPHHRMPVILHQTDEKDWLNPNLSLSEVTSLLEPYSAAKMNAYRIDPIIKKVTTNNKDALKPLATPLAKETAFELEEEIELWGMGDKPKKG